MADRNAVSRQTKAILFSKLKEFKVNVRSRIQIVAAWIVEDHDY